MPTIYTMNIDGSDQRRLTTTPGFDGNPSWSPEGSRIVFASDGTNPIRLTNNPGRDHRPSWR